MRPRYGTPAWLILASLEAAGTCPSEAEQLWRGLASPLSPKAAPRWTLTAHGAIVAQLVRAGWVVELPDGRLVASSCALVSQIREAA